MTAPEVSVVMGVFDSAATLRETVASVLSQASVDLELIVVDDGSTDGSGQLLDELAANDARLQVIHQANQGLTAALVRGCGLARAAFIARQDAGGDVSLPGRIATQLGFMRAHPQAVMSCVGTRLVGPAGEFLDDLQVSDEELRRGLSTLRIPGVRGPSHHGSVMFRKDAYERVGGYRRQYLVAQDMDLWLRLFEIGSCLALPEVLYETRSTVGSITGRFHDRQLVFGGIAIEAARSRRAGLAEPPFPLADMDWASLARRSNARADANLHYFLGSCLHGSDRPLARRYFWQALRSNPAHWKAAYKLLRTYLE